MKHAALMAATLLSMLSPQAVASTCFIEENCLCNQWVHAFVVDGVIVAADGDIAVSVTDAFVGTDFRELPAAGDVLELRPDAGAFAVGTRILLPFITINSSTAEVRHLEPRELDADGNFHCLSHDRVFSSSEVLRVLLSTDCVSELEAVGISAFRCGSSPHFSQEFERGQGGAAQVRLARTGGKR